MLQSRGKLIYNIVLSILMAYFIIRSLVVFYGYLFHYEDKLYAKGEIHLKINEPVTVAQVAAAIPANYETTTTENNQLSIKYRANNFPSLQKQKQELLNILQNKFPNTSFELLQTQQTPPKVSKRILRLELTVHIPIFIMALFWFGYLFRWYKETKKTARNKPSSKSPKK